MRIWPAIFILIFLPLNSQASENQSLPGSCGPVLEGEILGTKQTTPPTLTFASEARAAGIRFVMIKLSPSRFAEVLKAAKTGEDVLIQADLQHTSNGLVPLFQRYTGQWAHQLIRNGNDSIGMGERFIPLKEWMIGLVFPVDILDHIEFELLSNISNVGTLSSRRISPQQLGRALSYIEKNPEYDSYDTNIYSTFSASTAIPLSWLAMTWVPAPLLSGEGRVFPGWDNPLVPHGGAFKVQIYTQNPAASPHLSWRNIVPPPVDTMTWFDPKVRLGTWFNVVPDWEHVERELKQSNSEKALLHTPLKPNNP